MCRNPGVINLSDKEDAVGGQKEKISITVECSRSRTSRLTKTDNVKSKRMSIESAVKSKYEHRTYILQQKSTRKGQTNPKF